MTAEINLILKRMSEDRLYILDIIEFSFIFKKLLKENTLKFSDLVKPSGGYEWENFATMIPYLPIEIVESNLDHLLEGFMDLNWPGTKILYGYLSEMNIGVLKKFFLKAINNAIEVNDSDWVYFLLVFLSDDKVGLVKEFTKEISVCKVFLEANDIDF
jgi:hypothetical protein